METRSTSLYTLINTSLLQQSGRDNNNQNSARKNAAAPQDILQVQNDLSQATTLKRTRLISENTEQLENGFRRTQKFENADGRNFTRIEEFTSSDNQARRIVSQENASGSTTLLEDVYDRREDGSFRLTQRFTNEIGETSVNIAPNAQPPNPDIILGRAPRTDAPPANISQRGTELDLIT